MRRPEPSPSGLGPVLGLAALLLLLCLGLAFLLLPPDLIRSPGLAFTPPPASEPLDSTGSISFVPGPLPSSAESAAGSNSLVLSPAEVVDSVTGSTAEPSSTTLLADSQTLGAPVRLQGTAEPLPASSATPPISNDIPPPPDDPGLTQAPPPDGPAVSFLGGPLDRLDRTDDDREPFEPAPIERLDPPSAPPDLANLLPIPTDTAPAGSSSSAGGPSGSAPGTAGGAPRSGEEEDQADRNSLFPDEADTPRRVGPRVRSAAAKAADRVRNGPGLDPYVDSVDWRTVPAWRQTRFFNIRAQGSFFAFVVDCSGSMDDDLRLFRAKRELRRCIDAMRLPQRYSVVFFNDQAIPMAGGLPRSADSKNNRSTFSWLDSISSDGGTDPREAMALALSLRPDAVFLLTDGEFPTGTEAMIIARNPDRIPIHCINLGSSPGAASLRAIAESSGGRYASPR